MNLYIDTSKNEYIVISILNGDKIIAKEKIEAKYRQAEKLLLSIDKMLHNNKINKKEIKKIIVNEEGEGFSSLRIGIVTANALAYGLAIPVLNTNNKAIETKSFSIVKPEYSQEPSIG